MPETLNLHVSSSPVIGQYFNWSDKSGTPTTTLSYNTIREDGVNYSFGNPMVGGRYVGGGPWYMEKIRCRCYGSGSTAFRYGYARAYEGEFVAKQSMSRIFVPGTKAEEQADLFTYGAQATRALNPARPDFSGFAALTELLREGPGMVADLYKHNSKVRDYMESKGIPFKRRAPRSPLGNSQSSAERSIANKFGWQPLLRDIRDFTDALADLKKRTEDLLANEGKFKHQRVLLSKNTNQELTTQGTYTGTQAAGMAVPTLVTQCYSSVLPGGWTRHVTETTKIWAEGYVKYHLPSGPRGDKWKAQLYKRLLGAYPTPSQVWQVLPWTWLLNYFTPAVKDFIENADSSLAERVVYRGAWLMKHRKGEENYTVSIPIFTSLTAPSLTNAYRTKQHDLKTRVAASPLGFGLRFGGLSPAQSVLLAELGLSRGKFPRTL